jgi:hypothetical protein
MSSRAGKSFAGCDDLRCHAIATPAEFWSMPWDFASTLGDNGNPPFLVDASKMPEAQERRRHRPGVLGRAAR